MHRLQHTMLLPINFRDALRGGRAPGKEDDAVRAHACHSVNDPLREAFPAAVRVAVGLVRAHRQARVEHQHATLRPGCQQPTAVRGCLKPRVIILQTDVDVLQRGRSRCRWPYREAEPVRLVVVMVGILAENHGLDTVDGSISGPSLDC